MKDPGVSPYLFDVFRRQPVLFTRGRGAWLWDAAGKKYLDFFSGLAVCGLGHAHPAVARAVARQARTLVHTSNIYHTAPQRELARELSRRTFGGKVFFGNSGAEANECAIKLARRFGHLTPRRGRGRYEIVVFADSFHGRTMATLSATAQKKYQKGFGPMLAGFPVAAFGDLDSVRRKIGPRTCAVLVEPVQGEGGVNVAGAGFFRGLRALCRKHDLLLMFDEIQTGVGRTGKLFAYEHLGVTPDVLTVAKGLANGLPIGACLARPAVADLFKPGDHASTFSGGPVVCEAGLAVLEVLSPRMLARVAALGRLIGRELEGWRKELPFIREVRGLGLMRGIELDRPGAGVVARCRDAGLLVNCTADRVIRLLPPFILTDAEARAGLRILKKALSEPV
jgi:predicted acetylornithine/succinylornithine family transaminase